MTDQRQSTGDQWAPPAPTLEQADPDWTEPESSTQDSTPRDWTGTETPAEDGTVYQSAAHESAVDEPVVEELPTDGNAVDEPVAEERIAAQPAGDGDGFVAVDGSVPADDADLDDADLDHADREHADSEHAVGMASVPDADPAPDTEADIADRGDSDSPSVDAQDAARTEGPDGAYGIEEHPADAQAVVEEQEPADAQAVVEEQEPADAQAVVEEREPAEEYDGVAVVTDTGQPADGVDERADVADGEVPLVPVPVDDAAAPDVTDSGELLPGDVPEEPGLALFDGETAGRFRDRWQELQLRFVDDPHAAASLAGALVDEVVAALRDAVDRQRSALEDWQSGDGVDAHSEDTERLRVAVRRYRDFLDRLLGL
jgi:hypothetical protein